jgi:hypothetical protein
MGAIRHDIPFTAAVQLSQLFEIEMRDEYKPVYTRSYIVGMA